MKLLALWENDAVETLADDDEDDGEGSDGEAAEFDDGESLGLALADTYVSV